MNRSRIVFDPACDTEPFPIVRHATSTLHTTLKELAGSVVAFDRDGAIHKSGLGGSVDLISNDACGSIPVHLNGSNPPAFVALVHNGVLSALVSANGYSGHTGFRFSPCWEMDLRESESVTDESNRHDCESMHELIRMIELDRTVQVSRTIDLMAGIALCDQVRLYGL